MGKNVTPKNPCPICGKPDWCMTIDGQNGPLHYCKRVRESEVLSGGNCYLLIRETDECGVYEEKTQHEEAKKAYIERLKAENPNWKPQGGAKNKASKPSVKPVNSSYVNRSEYKHDYIVATEDADRLDRVYRTFLDCLILEEKHEKVLKDEWGDELFKKIISKHPIKSIPMVDKERFNYGAYSKLPWRKNVIQQMYDRGIKKEDLVGVPMFYQLGNGEMTFYKLSGMVFPIYSPKGKIVRLRVRDDFPAAKGVFRGEEGNFYFSKDGWYFKGESEPILVYQPKTKTYKVKLDKNGVPLSDGDKKSKVSGKYKNLSSFKEMYDDENKRIYNCYTNGSQSGSYPSLYCKEGDDFTVVYFTEGEKKAMVSNEILGSPCVSFPGVGTFRTAFERRCCEVSIIEYCLSKGMKKGVLAYDADKNSNAVVLKQEQNCLIWFIENKIDLAIGSWNEAFGKGLDDILLKGIRPTIHNIK